mmetsp:Transcript_13205/g.26499  ORF Transcript_13205/g.26499 Transcript_13205/m.26499 type:complete len:208 (-) Transcript_13205:283-906(-)
MVRVPDSVGDQIPHVWIGGFKVHFETESPGSFVVQTHFHSFEDLEVAFDARVAISSGKNIGRRNGSYLIGIFSLVPGQNTLHGQISLGFHFGLAHVAAVRQSLFNQRDGQFVESLEVVAAVGGAFGCPTHPLKVVHKGIDVFFRFGIRIRVVVPKHAASIFGSHAQFFKGQRKVHVDGFGVAHVQVSVGFRGKSGSNDGTVHLGVFG